MPKDMLHACSVVLSRRRRSSSSQRPARPGTRPRSWTAWIGKSNPSVSIKVRRLRRPAAIWRMAKKLKLQQGRAVIPSRRSLAGHLLLPF
jgi:hypothetical protein